MDKNDELNKEASALCGAALQRLARGYEADPEKRRDLLQLLAGPTLLIVMAVVLSFIWFAFWREGQKVDREIEKLLPKDDHQEIL